MLFMPTPLMFGGDVFEGPTQTDYVGDSTNLTTYTFSTRDFGAADANRFVIVGSIWRGSGSSGRDVNSFDIGGSAATELATSTTGSAANAKAALYGRFISDDANTDVSITFSNSCDFCGIAILRMLIKPEAQATPHDVIEANSGAGSIDVLEDGVVIAIAQNDGTMTWTGLTERDEQEVQSGRWLGLAFDSGMSAEINRTIDSGNSTGEDSDALAAISLGPA